MLIKLISELTLIFARPNIFVTTTPSCRNCRRSCGKDTDVLQLKFYLYISYLEYQFNLFHWHSHKFSCNFKGAHTDSSEHKRNISKSAMTILHNSSVYGLYGSLTDAGEVPPLQVTHPFFEVSVLCMWPWSFWRWHYHELHHL